jgi:hypothetical protein
MPALTKELVKREKPQKNRHTGAGRYPEAVDFIDPTTLDPGLRRGDGVFFNPLLISECPLCPLAAI